MGDTTPERVLLMQCGSDGEAAIIRTLLATYGIPCQVVPDGMTSPLPIALGAEREVRILVPSERASLARTLLAEHRRQGLRVVPGDKV